MEHPEYWLTFGSPWEIEREDVRYEIQFYGLVNESKDAYGNTVVGMERACESRWSGATRRRWWPWRSTRR